MKKYQKILFFITLLVFIAINIFTKKFGDMDEIWNYNFSNCISKGLIPYKDFNMIQMPLFPMIMGLILKFTFNELIVMRIASLFLWISIFFLIYRIIDTFKILKIVNYIIIFMICFIYKEYFYIDYNIFSVFLTLIILYLELEKNEKSIIINIIIGMLGGLVFLTKQTIGVTVCFGIILSSFIPFLTHKNSVYFKNIIFRIIGMIFPILLFLIYLILNNSITYFLDYTFFSLKTFSNKISYCYLVTNSSFVIRILAIIVPSFLTLFIIYAFKNKNEKMLKMCIFSLATFVLVFPISDSIHLLFGSIISILSIVYYVKNIFNFSLILKIKYYIIAFFMGLSSIMILLFIIASIVNVNKINYLSKLKHFKYIPIDSNDEKKIKTMDNYILKNKKNVYILNFDAAIYMIPIDHYNKDYDMFLLGNIGKNGENGQIKKISKSKDIFLILKDGINRNWQNPEKVRKYVKKNLKRIGEIDIYDIYINC